MSPAGDRAAFARRSAGFLGLLAALWLAFAALERAFPYIAPGHQLIYELAQETIREADVFPDDGRVGVAVFGASDVQAGFVPQVFDGLSGGIAYSYNFGLPGTTTFVDELRALVVRGQVPDVVVLTSPPGYELVPGLWERLKDDSFVIESLFPFRTLARDATLFLIRSLSRGGPLAYYAAARANVEQARRDRGYFFIEGMSHYPGHRLPDDFRLESDTPELPGVRPLAPEGPFLDDLLELHRRGGFRTLYVPGYARISARAASLPDPEARARIEPLGIEVIGPDYFSYPNRLFSDPVHVNPEGAVRYTTDLWELLAPVVRERWERERGSARG